MNSETLGQLLAHMHQQGQLTPAMLAQIVGSTPVSSSSSTLPVALSLAPSSMPPASVPPQVSSNMAPPQPALSLSSQLITTAPQPPSVVFPPPRATSISTPVSGVAGTPPLPLLTPAVPYNSMAMLQSVAQGGSSSPFGGFGNVSGLGLQSGIANLVSQRLNTGRSDRTRREHANATLPRRKPRSAATPKPSLSDPQLKLEDCMDTAALPNGESTQAINLSLQGRLPFPERHVQTVCYLLTFFRTSLIVTCSDTIFLGIWSII